jgi:hypothetical protein
MDNATDSDASLPRATNRVDGSREKNEQVTLMQFAQTIKDIAPEYLDGHPVLFSQRRDDRLRRPLTVASAYDVMGGGVEVKHAFGKQEDGFAGGRVCLQADATGEGRTGLQIKRPFGVTPG